jgi:cytochrome P450
MTQATRYDPWISGTTTSPKTSGPNTSTARCTCTATRTSCRSTRHPAVLGNGGRGGSFGHDARLIPLEIDGEDHKKWRRLLDPMFAPKQIARLEGRVRQLATELIDGFGFPPACATPSKTSTSATAS